MKKNIVVKTGFAILLLASISCDKSNPLNPLAGVCGQAWTESVANEVSAYNAALTAYSQEPTAENCASFKASAKNYYDALKEVADCIPGTSRAQFNDAINEAKAEVDKEECD